MDCQENTETWRLPLFYDTCLSADRAGQPPTLTFTNAARADDNTFVYWGTADTRPRLELNLTAPDSRPDRTTLYWQTGASAAAEAASDAWKVTGPSHPQLWSEAGTERLRINGLPLTSGPARSALSLAQPWPRQTRTLPSGN